jgi:hypothetical protein
MAGDPGSSVESATNSNAISTKPTAAKKVKAGIAALRRPKPNTLSNDRFPKTQAQKSRAEGNLATRSNVRF